nr:hypothetical protein [Piscirickettsia salmonis]
MGRDHQSYLLTLVDKANKMCCIRKMPNKQAKTGTVAKNYSELQKGYFLVLSA